MTFSVSEFTLSVCWQDLLTERPEKERIIEGANDGTKRKDVRFFAHTVSIQIKPPAHSVAKRLLKEKNSAKCYNNILNGNARIGLPQNNKIAHQNEKKMNEQFEFYLILFHPQKGQRCNAQNAKLSFRPCRFR